MAVGDLSLSNRGEFNTLPLSRTLIIRLDIQS